MINRRRAFLRRTAVLLLLPVTMAIGVVGLGREAGLRVETATRAWSATLSERHPNLAVEVVNVQRGWWRSTLRTTWRLALPDGSLLTTDWLHRVDHGPWPWLHWYEEGAAPVWQPVLALATSTLLAIDGLPTTADVRIDSRIAENGRHSSLWNAAPMRVRGLRLGTLQGSSEGDLHTHAWTAHWRWSSIRQDTPADSEPPPLQFYIQDGALTLDQPADDHNLPLGRWRLQAAALQVTPTGGEAWRIAHADAGIELAVAGEHLRGTLTLALGPVHAGEQRLGEGKMRLQLERLHAGSLAGWLTQAGNAGDEPAQTRVLDLLRAVLAQQPVLRLDPFDIQTPEGRAQLTAAVTLRAPPAAGEWTWPMLVGLGEGELRIDDRLLRDVLAEQAGTDARGEADVTIDEEALAAAVEAELADWQARDWLQRDGEAWTARLRWDDAGLAVNGHLLDTAEL